MLLKTAPETPGSKYIASKARRCGYPAQETMAPKTSDGYIWTPCSGVVAGLECDAYVSPQRSLASPSKLYDVIVVGAGYAGLAAARDLATSSMCPFLDRLDHTRRPSCSLAGG